VAIFNAIKKREKLELHPQSHFYLKVIVIVAGWTQADNGYEEKANN